MPPRRLEILRLLIGSLAIAAPLLHSITDAMEWVQQGYSTPLLWLNYLAFLPMAWLLLGLYVVHETEVGVTALVGALLYGVAFSYFAHTTLFALEGSVPDYDALWSRLGGRYTFHGALMIVGGGLFAWAVWRARWLPRFPVALFAAGLLINLGCALFSAPAMGQTLGTLVRNAGLIGMGCAILGVTQGRRNHV